jgi:hypothetical protein
MLADDGPTPAQKTADCCFTDTSLVLHFGHCDFMPHLYCCHVPNCLVTMILKTLNCLATTLHCQSMLFAAMLSI